MAGSAQRASAGRLSKRTLQACLTNANVVHKRSATHADLMALVESYNLNPLDVQPLRLLSLPHELVLHVASLLAKAGSDSTKALLRLGTACKELHDIVHGSDVIWRAAWDVHVSTATPKSLEGVSERTTCQQRMLLLATTGCQLCEKRPRAKTITWVFGVRTCAGCLTANMVSEKRLIKHYGLPKQALQQLTRLDHGFHGEDWSFERFVMWKPDVLPLLSEVHGVASWDEYETMRRERLQTDWAKRQQARTAQAEQRAKEAEQFKQQQKQVEKAKRKRKREQAARKAAKRQRLQAAELRSLEIDMKKPFSAWAPWSDSCLLWPISQAK